MTYAAIVGADEPEPLEPLPPTRARGSLRWLFYAGFVVWFSAIVYVGRVLNDTTLVGWILVGVPILFILGLIVYGKVKYGRSHSN